MNSQENFLHQVKGLTLAGTSSLAALGLSKAIGDAVTGNTSTLKNIINDLGNEPGHALDTTVKHGSGLLFDIIHNFSNSISSL